MGATDLGPPAKPWLSQATYQLACQLAGSCAQTDDLIARLQAVGLPIEDQIGQQAFHKNVATQTKKLFFPDQP